MTGLVAYLLLALSSIGVSFEAPASPDGLSWEPCSGDATQQTCPLTDGGQGYQRKISNGF